MTMRVPFFCATALFLRALLTPVTAELPDYIPIGSLFHNADEETRNAYFIAVQDVNEDSSILPNNQLAIKAQEVPLFAVFPASQYVCELLETGVAGVLGPAGTQIARHVESMLDHKEVPHINGRWDERETLGSFQINLHPSPEVMEAALVDLVQELDWQTFTIIYEDFAALKRVTALVKLYDGKGPIINVRQLPEDYNYRRLFLDLKAAAETHFVIECSTEILYDVLRQIQQVGLMGEHTSFIIPSLDLWTLDLEAFQHCGTNITGFRMIDPEDERVHSVTSQLQFPLPTGRLHNTIRLHSALMYDSVKLLANALHTLQHPLMYLRNLSCDSSDSWEHGSSLINYMRTSEFKGLTGNVRFDNDGIRSQLDLDIVELVEEGLRTIGSWRTADGINITRLHPKLVQETRQTHLFNKTLVVLIALTKPYGMLKEDTLTLSGNDRFEGFAIEMIHELSLMLNFNYTFEVQADNDYGSYNPATKQWTGMMKQLVDKRVDVAITDLTITSEREFTVDFTNPFMNLGISILYKRPTRIPPSLFSFMSPFSHDIWFVMLAAYIGVSLLLFAMARITPKEWNNPYPCIDDPEELENQFSMKNAFWFTIGALMQQGSEIAAIAPSTRMVSAIWWFFTLIMVSTYTANLAAFLTIESLSSPIRNVEDLANQKTIKYGAKRGGSTANFFRDSNHPTYSRMWRQMQQWGDVFTKDNDEGLLRVQRENYAFFMESTSIEYMTERNCDVTQVGGLLDAKNYGIAMRKNSPYRNALSAGVLKLAELGRLHQMKTRWWKQKRGGGACEQKKGANDVDELGLDNVGGVFVVLALGCGVAVFACIGELLWTIRKICQKDGVPFKDELMAHLLFAIQCKSTKPAQMNHRQRNEDESNKSLAGDGDHQNIGDNQNIGDIRSPNDTVEDQNAYGFRQMESGTARPLRYRTGYD